MIPERQKIPTLFLKRRGAQTRVRLAACRHDTACVKVQKLTRPVSAHVFT